MPAEGFVTPQWVKTLEVSPGWGMEETMSQSTWQLSPSTFLSHSLSLGIFAYASGRAWGRPGGLQIRGSWRRAPGCPPWGAHGQPGHFIECGGVRRQLYLFNAKKPSWFNMIVAAALINQNN